MQHDRAVFAAILADIIGIQPFGQDEIHLKGAALPVATNRIGENKLKLWPIKCPFTWVQLERIAGGLCGVAQGGFGFVPDLIRAGAFFRTIREFDREFCESEILVHGR